MNACVKTGLKFLELETGLIRTGDLFHFSGMFQIRGIPCDALPPETKIDVLVSNCIICQRADSKYSDSQIGVKLIAPSDEFVKFIQEWYPYLVIVKEEPNGKAP